MTLSDPFLRALGRVTANFAALELHMDFAIGGLVSPDQAIGQAVAAELSFRNKCGMLSSLFQLKVNAAGRADAIECVSKMRDFLSRANHLEARRNQLIHSAWLVGEDDPPDKATRLKITAKQDKGLRQLTEVVDAEALNQLADELRAAAAELIPALLGCLENRPSSL